jgi:hypothetical protein
MWYDVERDIAYFTCLTTIEILFFIVCIIVLYETIKYIVRLVRNGKQ